MTVRLIVKIGFLFVEFRCLFAVFFEDELAAFHAEECPVAGPLGFVFDFCQGIQRIGKVGFERLLQIKDVLIGAFDSGVKMLMIEFVILLGIEQRPRKSGKRTE